MPNEPDDKSDEEPPARRRVMSHMAQCNFRWTTCSPNSVRLGLWHRALDITLLQTYIKTKIQMVRGLVTKALERDLMKCILRKIRGFQLWHGGTTMVYTLSNEHGVQPVQYANWYSSKEKKSLQVIQPNVIHKYNKFMGGVDLFDNNISNYLIDVCGKKWYMILAFWLFDVCMTNAWMLARNKKLTLDQLSFRRQWLVTNKGKKKGEIKMISKEPPAVKDVGDRDLFIASGSRGGGGVVSCLLRTIA
ncbi:hypothetical protein PR048_009528 [Dryococelus australis]|uniref:PiggyBac transposable element-derived protein domain-containing protein n=1 Tax=Dryococelus australis TaxID=614101 RepID=A0ABQ9I055_9NEOP|nr:hypothetical protein PR048_009528 [Dryococelus australis]